MLLQFNNAEKTKHFKINGKNKIKMKDNIFNIRTNLIILFVH